MALLQEMGERAAKIISRAGLGSRREAERWIKEGRVRVDGKVLEELGRRIEAGERLALDGRDVPRKEEAARLWRYHKPKGLLVSRKDAQSRPTIFEDLAQSTPSLPPHLLSVGRLDMMSEGLLLLTNSGFLARHLELPASGFERRYLVRARGVFGKEAEERLSGGMRVKGVLYAPVFARLKRPERKARAPQTASQKTSTYVWLEMRLKEGKNKEIRILLEHLGLTVTRLLRTDYGPFSLRELPRGMAKEVPQHLLQKKMAGFF